jgi:hypothetical protein
MAILPPEHYCPQRLDPTADVLCSGAMKFVETQEERVGTDGRRWRSTTETWPWKCGHGRRGSPSPTLVRGRRGTSPIYVYDMWVPLASEVTFFKSHNNSTKRASKQSHFSRSHSPQLLFQKSQLNQTHPYDVLPTFQITVCLTFLSQIWPLALFKKLCIVSYFCWGWLY